MVKTLDQDATYEPSKRSLNWLKVKKDYLQGMTDSCDLVPIGGYYGKGRRTGVYGAFLLACYNDEEEEYQSICKIGTGFSDTALQGLADALNAKRADGPRAYYRVPETAALTPDVWFEPAQASLRGGDSAGDRAAPCSGYPAPHGGAARPRAPQPPRLQLPSRSCTGVGGACGRPFHFARAPSGRRPGRLRQGHRAPLPALPARARRQGAGGCDQRVPGGANVQ